MVLEEKELGGYHEKKFGLSPDHIAAGPGRL